MAIVQTIHVFFLSKPLCLLRTGHVELGLPVIGEQTPVLLVHHLAIVTLALGLPRLVKGLEVEDVDPPGQDPTDSLLPVAFGIGRAGRGSTVVGSTICHLS